MEQNYWVWQSDPFIPVELPSVVFYMMRSHSGQPSDLVPIFFGQWAFSEGLTQNFKY